MKQTCPVPIGFENIQSGAKGYYHQIDKRIAIQDGMSEVQTIKTLIHEMAHQKLHAIPEEAQEAIKSRSSKEVEAESIAYVVCQHYGINTSDYSFGYVAGWSDGKETTELKASLGEIREAAAEMIEAIDQAVEKELESRNNVAEAITSETESREKELEHQPRTAEKKRTSVRKMLKEEKEKETKTPRKKKVKETEACV